MEVVLLRTSTMSACAARSSTSPAATRATTCCRAGSPSRRRRARVRELERREALRARHEAKTAEQAQAIAAALEATVLRFEVNAGPTGALFGSVTPTNVADRIWEEQKIRLDRRKLGIDTIKRIGRYTVPIEVFADVTRRAATLVVPEGGELPPEEELEAAMEADGRPPRSAGRREPASRPSEEPAEAPLRRPEPPPRRRGRRGRGGRGGRPSEEPELRAPSGRRA